MKQKATATEIWWKWAEKYRNTTWNLFSKSSLHLCVDQKTRHMKQDIFGA